MLDTGLRAIQLIFHAKCMVGSSKGLMELSTGTLLRIHIICLR
jgi:hypothetical protein